MSIFNIKIKTKAGNDIKKKEIFTCLFKLNYKKNLLTNKVVAEYTYRIMNSTGSCDPKTVLKIKDSQNILSIEDLTLKVIINLCCIVGKLTKDMNVNPDIIVFLSPDINGNKNKSWTYLKDVLAKPKKDDTKRAKDKDFTNFLSDTSVLPYHAVWNEHQCKELSIKKKELDLLRTFVELNPNTTFLNYDPNSEPIKYAKSIRICDMLNERLHRVDLELDSEIKTP